MSVSVIIPTFNHAHFLADAIASVVAQTRAADEIIVVDDGSTDDPAAVVAGFTGVRLIRQNNRGLAAARNAGLQSSTTSHVAFLDADDRLLPIALEAGLGAATAQPDRAFVYGGFYVISKDGKFRGPDCFIPVRDDGYLDLLRFNVVGSVATTIHRRDCLMEIGGFDESLRYCEDHDLYLRVARKHGIASHPAIVAEYRIHGQNVSTNLSTMLAAVMDVLDRHEARVVLSPAEKAALTAGRANWRDHFAWRMFAHAYECRGSFESFKLLVDAMKTSPRVLAGKAPVRIVRWLNGGGLTTKFVPNANWINRA